MPDMCLDEASRECNVVMQVVLEAVAKPGCGESHLVSCMPDFRVVSHLERCHEELRL